MKTLAWFALFASCAVAQVKPASRVYKNERFRFEFAYPASFKLADLPCTVAQSYTEFGYQRLTNLYSANQDASVRVSLDRRPFNVDTVKEFHNRGGDDWPEQKIFGKNTFYYYGRGGGGVDYPDEYFYDLDGQILEISFDGPYVNDNTPASVTKEMEKAVLSSFTRTR